MGNHQVELKDAETYCSACDLTRRFLVPKDQALSSLDLSCKLCDRKLRMRVAKAIPIPEESGTYLIARQTKTA